MGMFDEVEIDKDAAMVPVDYRLATYQTKDLDCLMTIYRVDATGQFLKVVSKHGEETLMYTNNLNQDISCGTYGKHICLHVRNGEVKSVDISGATDEDYWDGNEPIWIEFINLNKSRAL